jgi:hypothetical protein
MRPRDSNIGIDNSTPNQIADINIEKAKAFPMKSRGQRDSAHLREKVSAAGLRGHDLSFPM